MADFALAKKEDDINIREKSYIYVAKHLLAAATPLSTSSKKHFRKNYNLKNGRNTSSECSSSQNMSFNDKQNMLNYKRSFSCLTLEHNAKQQAVFLSNSFVFPVNKR